MKGLFASLVITGCVGLRIQHPHAICLDYSVALDDGGFVRINSVVNEWLTESI